MSAAPAVPRIVLLGTGAAFSAAAFRALVDAGIVPVGVVVDGDHHPRTIVAVSANGHHETLPSLAAARGLPVRAAGDADDPGLVRWIDDLAPDYLVVACFGQRLPQALCALARHDCLNLHPSLLPRYRGPAPLFWQLRAGERDTGVTLHRVTDVIDAGPVVARAPVALDDGRDGSALDERLAAEGVALLVDVLHRHPEPPDAEPQDEALASYHGVPGDDDFRVSPDWSARRLFNFVRGTGHWGRAYRVSVDGRDLLLREVLDFRPDGAMASPLETDGDTVRLHCNPGHVVARLA